MPVSVGIGILEDQERILLIKRERGCFTGFWGLPGGKVEEMEHFDDTVVREFLEETDLRVKFARLLGVVSEIVYEGDKESHALIFCCKVQLLNNSKTNSSGTKWFTWEELKARKDIIPSDLLFLQHFYFGQAKKYDYLKVISTKSERGYEVKIIP